MIRDHYNQQNPLKFPNEKPPFRSNLPDRSLSNLLFHTQVDCFPPQRFLSSASLQQMILKQGTTRNLYPSALQHTLLIPYVQPTHSSIDWEACIHPFDGNLSLSFHLSRVLLPGLVSFSQPSTSISHMSKSMQ